MAYKLPSFSDLTAHPLPPALRTLKRGYIFMYNLVQFLGFSWIFVNMTVRLFILGQGKLDAIVVLFEVVAFISPTSSLNDSLPSTTDSFYDTFHTMADMMYFCQILAAAEIVHASIGLVKTVLIPTVIQVLGRNVILFVIFGSLVDMQNKAVVFFVFYFWSAIEIFRYPYYMLSCIDSEWKLLTWLRYTIWIPLYPLGVLAEGRLQTTSSDYFDIIVTTAVCLSPTFCLDTTAVAVIQSLRIFTETGLYSIDIPWPLSFSISFSYVLQIYLVLMLLGKYCLDYQG
ncbi:HACD3 dehydratase, partial [Polypterus senegalus]